MVARREPTERGSVLQAGRRFKGRCRSWLLNTVSGADCQVLFEKDSWPGGRRRQGDRRPRVLLNAARGCWDIRALLSKATH